MFAAIKEMFGTARTGQQRRNKRGKNAFASIERLESRSLLTTQLYSAVADAFITNISGQDTAANLGGRDSLNFFAADTSSTTPEMYRSFVGFNFNPSAFASVNTASVELYLYDQDSYGNPDDDMDISVYAVTAEWDEGTGTDQFNAAPGVSWLNAESSPATSWSSPGGDFSPLLLDTVTVTPSDEDSWISFDVTTAVQDWNLTNGASNRGLMFVTEDGTGVEYFFASREYDDGSGAGNFAPRLTASEPRTVEHSAVADTFITNVTGQDTAANLGGRTSLNFFAGDTSADNAEMYRSLVDFDFVPSYVSSVGSATVELYQYAHDAYGNPDDEMKISVYAVTTDWDEGTGTDQFNSAPGTSWLNAKSSPVDSWSSAGGDFNPMFLDTVTVTPSGDGSWVSFDVTDAVRDWKLTNGSSEHGFIFVTEEGTGIEYFFASREYNDGSGVGQFSPKLTVSEIVDEEVYLPRTENYSASADTFITNISGQNTDANLGGRTSLNFFAGDTSSNSPEMYRSLVDFNFVPGDMPSVGSATVQLYQYDNDAYGNPDDDMKISVYAVTEDWDEGTGTDQFNTGAGASWINSKTSPMDSWSAAGGDFSPMFLDTVTVTPATDDSWISFDVTTAVQNWKLTNGASNHGLIFVTEEGVGVEYYFASREYDDGSGVGKFAPRLTVSNQENSELTASVSSMASTVGENAGTANFEVSLSRTPDEAVTFGYSVSSLSTASSGSDYTLPSPSTVSFPAGTTMLTQTISIPIVNDSVSESTESLILNLDSTNVAVSSSSARVDILDNDNTSSATVSINGGSVTEGNFGETTPVTISLSLTEPLSTSVFVDYETVSQSATEGVDYTGVSGQLEFSPGQTFRTFDVNVLGDAMLESNENFRVEITSVTGATLGTASAIVTILNDDQSTGTLPEFTRDDFNASYIGRFKMPAGTGGFKLKDGYGGTGLAFGDDGAPFLLTTGETNSTTPSANPYLVKLRIPTSDLLATTAPVATIDGSTDLRGLLEYKADGRNGSPTFHGNGDGNLDNSDPPIYIAEEIRVDDLMVVDGHIVGSTYIAYDNGPSSHTHFRVSTTELDNVTDADVTGLFNIGTGFDTSSIPGMDGTDAGYLGGYMASVPPEWQGNDKLGGTHIVGQTGISVISRTSRGPSAFSFNAGEVGIQPNVSLDGHLLYPDYANRFAWKDPGFDGNGNYLPGIFDDTPAFNFNSTVDGAVIVPNTRTMMLFGSTGASGTEDNATARTWYGDSYDPSTPSDNGRPGQGPHSESGYEYQIWSYDLDAITGATNPWDIEPTDDGVEVWRFDFSDFSGSGVSTDAAPAKYIGGTAFDPETGRFYISQQMPSAEPIVHVFQLQANQLVAKSGESGTTPPANSEVTLANLDSILPTAVSLWSATGLTTGDLSKLQSMKIAIADLDGGRLALTTGDTIVVDTDAAGHGWFKDSTPSSNSEFTTDGIGLLATSGGDAEGKMDLLSALLHELGHALGNSHDSSDLMHGSLDVSRRFLP